MKIISIVILVVLIVAIGPFFLLWGANFILEAMRYPEIPYTLNSWFGSLLIGVTLRGTKG